MDLSDILCLVNGREGEIVPSAYHTLDNDTKRLIALTEKISIEKRTISEEEFRQNSGTLGSFRNAGSRNYRRKISIMHKISMKTPGF